MLSYFINRYFFFFFINNIVNMFDLFSANPTLRTKQKPYSSSLFLGILTFIILCLFIALLSIRLNDAITKQDYQKFQAHSENDNQFQIDNFMFAITFINSKDLNMQEYFSIYIQSQNDQTSQQEISLLKLCQLNQWKALGQNYTKIFQYQNLSFSYCPENPQNISIRNIKQTKFRIVIQDCRDNYQQNCKSYSNYLQNFNYKPMEIQIKFLSKNVLIKESNPINYIIKTISLSYQFYVDLTFSSTKIIYQQINRFKVASESSRHIFDKGKQLIEGYLVGDFSLRSQYNLEQSNFRLLQIELITTQDVQVYTRKRLNIDQFIAGVAGLFEFVIIILLFFLTSYNIIKYELAVAGSFFNLNTDGKKIKPKDLNFRSYLKHSFFKWVKYLFCYEISDSESRQMEKTRDEASQTIDVKNLFRRLEFLEKTVESSFDKNSLKSIATLKPISISQLRDQRQILCYYDNIINQEEAATVEDAMGGHHESFEYLVKKKTSFKQIYKEITNIKQTKTSFPSDISQLLKISLINDLGIKQQISQCISHYPVIAEKALQINLSKSYEKLEERMTKAFLQLDENQKNQLIMKMPILILHRLRMRAIKIALTSSLQTENLQTQNTQKKQMEKQKKENQQPLLQKLRKTIKNFFFKFDIFSTQPSLRSDQQPHKQTLFFGFINLLVICYLTYLLVSELKKIVQFDSSKFQTVSYTENDNQTIEITNFMFALKLPGNNISEDRIGQQLQMFRLSLYDIQCFQTNVILVPCESQNWKLLGQNYYEQFMREQLYNAYCLNTTLTIKLSDPNINFCRLEFLLCGEYYCPGWYPILSKYYKLLIQQHGYYPFWIYYLSPYFQKGQSNPLYQIRKYKYLVNQDFVGVFRQTFNGLRIKTDTSLSPFGSNDILTNKSYEVKLPPSLYQLFYIFWDSFIVVEFRISGNVQVYDSKLENITEPFSYIGGLFFFIIFCLRILFHKYNQYRYELSVGENYFSFNSDGRKFTEKKLNIFTYIKYLIFICLRKMFRCRLKWLDTLEMHKTLLEVNQLLNVDKFLKRVQFLERVINIKINRNVILCLSLNEHLSIDEVRKKRMVLYYYERIVQLNEAATVEDALSQRSESLSHLKTSKKSISQQQIINFQRVNISSHEAFQISRKEYDTKEQIYNSMIQYLQIEQEVAKVISDYPGVAHEAEDIELDTQMNEIEEQITLAFLSLSPKMKGDIIKKMPLIILHRLRIKAKWIKDVAKNIHKPTSKSNESPLLNQTDSIMKQSLKTNKNLESKKDRNYFVEQQN